MRFRYYDGNNQFFNALFVEISSWMKNKKGCFLTPKEGKEFFEKVEEWANNLSEIKMEVKEGNKIAGGIKKKVDKIEKGVKILLNDRQIHSHKEPIWFNMLKPVASFTGREDELEKIYNELQMNYKRV